MSEIVRDVLRNEMTVIDNKVTTLEQEREKYTTLLGRTERQIEDLKLKRGELEKHLAVMDAAPPVAPASPPAPLDPPKAETLKATTKAK